MSSIEVIDMFEMLGIAPEEKEISDTKKAKTTNKDSKSKSKKVVDKSKIKDNSYKLPVKIYTGYREPIELTKENFDNKNDVDETRIVNALEKIYPEYASDITSLEKDSKNNSVLYAGFKSSSIISKGKIKLNANSKCMLGGMNFDLSTVMDDTECEVDVDEIAKVITQSIQVYTSISIARAKNDLLVPIFNLPKLNESLKFPILVHVFGRGKFEVTKEEYVTYLDEQSEDNECDVEFDKEVLVDIVLKKYPDFADGHLELQYNKELNFVLVCMKLKGITTSGPGKIEKIPTVGTTISLLFRQIPIEPSMFGGSEEVEGKDIIAFLSKEYPEYSATKTDVIYDKNSKMILPILKGSSKGAGITVVRDNFPELVKRTNIDNEEYSLFVYEMEMFKVMRRFRIESTPVSLTVAPMDSKGGGCFEYRLPLVPGKIYDCINYFFQIFTERYHTEVMLRLFYNKTTSSYFCDFPKQTVGDDNLKAEYDIHLQINHELFHIADFHSHNCFPAFFSPTDDADEKGNRIYGVFGPYKEGSDTNFLLRAGTGGYYVPIEKDILFDTGNGTYEERLSFCKALLKEVEEKIIFE